MHLMITQGSKAGQVGVLSVCAFGHTQLGICSPSVLIAIILHLRRAVTSSLSGEGRALLPGYRHIFIIPLSTIPFGHSSLLRASALPTIFCVQFPHSINLHTGQDSAEMRELELDLVSIKFLEKLKESKYSFVFKGELHATPCVVKVVSSRPRCQLGTSFRWPLISWQQPIFLKSTRS